MDMNQIMQMAQGFQQNAKNMQEELDQQSFTYESNGIKVEAKGDSSFVSVTIPEDLVPDAENRETLQDLLVVVFNQVLTKIKEEKANNMQNLTGGLNIPGLDLSGF
ncbi:MAG: YbaB/EbfC family nucleoid-associated protein [Lentisphaeria bacterium]|nr:YbaB/EbfC family nucleoid-associated protein [Lentisphaeria bacterium]